MKTILAAGLATALSAGAAFAELVKVESAHDVQTSIDRLTKIVESKGLTVFSRIDHAENARGIGLEMADSTVLIFGNPKGGTPLMKLNPEIGLDLPLRVLAYEDGGKVWLVYRKPTAIATEHGIDTEHPAVATPTGGLAKMTAAAAAE